MPVLRPSSRKHAVFCKLAVRITRPMFDTDPDSKNYVSASQARVVLRLLSCFALILVSPGPKVAKYYSTVLVTPLE